MSTLSSLNSSEPFINQHLHAAMTLFVAFCFISQETIELLSQDQNAFLTAFLDTTADMMTSVSIRNSVIELIEECYF